MYKQNEKITNIYFVLYGGLQVNLTISANKSIGDIVRAGNVLGEEAFYEKKPKYKESVRC